jgi:hypothetical protein
MLLTGTLNTITKKVQNDAISNGTTGTAHEFRHPWFQTWLMFIGEALCLIGFAGVKIKERFSKMDKVDESTERLLINDEEIAEEPQQPCFQWILVFPTFLDLTGTTLAGIGLLYINASVWQMLRGSMVIFRYFISHQIISI